MQNEKGEDVPTRLTTGWRVCIDYKILNEVITTQKVLFYTLINTGFEHFLCDNQPN